MFTRVRGSSKDFGGRCGGYERLDLACLSGRRTEEGGSEDEARSG